MCICMCVLVCIFMHACGVCSKSVSHVSGGAVPGATDAVVRLPAPESSVQSAGPGHSLHHRGEPTAAEAGAGLCHSESDTGS